MITKIYTYDTVVIHLSRDRTRKLNQNKGLDLYKQGQRSRVPLPRAISLGYTVKGLTNVSNAYNWSTFVDFGQFVFLTSDVLEHSIYTIITLHPFFSLFLHFLSFLLFLQVYKITKRRGWRSLGPLLKIMDGLHYPYFER